MTSQLQRALVTSASLFPPALVGLVGERLATKSIASSPRSSLPGWRPTRASTTRSAHLRRRGGILIISADERPTVAESAAYPMELDSSLATLLRLAWRTGRKRGS